MKIKYFIISSIYITSLLGLKSAYSQNIILISDVDDTIKSSGIKAGSLTMLGAAINSRLFFGLNHLYQAFHKNNSSENLTNEIYYVSGAPGPLRYFGVEFIKKYNFPFKSESYFLNKKIGENTFEAKIKFIKPIMEANPSSLFILVGDNGEFDPDVYKHINELYPKHKLHTFIHTVYSGKNPSAVDYSYNPTRDHFEIYENQIPFYTATDLAVQFYKLGLIQKEHLLNIYELSINNANNTLFHENWMTGCKGFMHSEWDKLVTIPVIQEDDEELLEKMDTFRQKITSIEGCKITVK